MQGYLPTCSARCALNESVSRAKRLANGRAIVDVSMHVCANRVAQKRSRNTATLANQKSANSSVASYVATDPGRCRKWAQSATNVFLRKGGRMIASGATLPCGNEKCQLRMFGPAELHIHLPCGAGRNVMRFRTSGFRPGAGKRGLGQHPCLCSLGPGCRGYQCLRKYEK